MIPIHPGHPRPEDSPGDQHGAGTPHGPEGQDAIQRSCLYEVPYGEEKETGKPGLATLLALAQGQKKREGEEKRTVTRKWHMPGEGAN